MSLTKQKIAEILSANKHYDASKWEYCHGNDSFVGTEGFGVSCKISWESAKDAADFYLDAAINEINADMEVPMNYTRKQGIVGFLNTNSYGGHRNWAWDVMGFVGGDDNKITRLSFGEAETILAGYKGGAMNCHRKQYIVEFLNTNHYFNYHDWRVGTTGFVTGREGDPTFLLKFDRAEEVIQDYREFLAGQGGVPHEPVGKSEPKPNVLDMYDKDYNPIPSKVIGRLKTIGDNARLDKDFDANEAINLAIDIINKSQNDASVKSSTKPTADEALEILNQEEHGGTMWHLVAVDDDDSDNVLTYPELIGTAMYYKAKGDNE